MIEISRKTSKECRLCLEKCGYLTLYKNRELCFHPNVTDAASDEIAAQRGMTRDDISILDNASAILSSGGGKAFSVRSSKVSRVSVTTPATKISSVAPSVASARRSDAESQKLGSQGSRAYQSEAKRSE